MKPGSQDTKRRNGIELYTPQSVNGPVRYERRIGIDSNRERRRIKRYRSRTHSGLFLVRFAVFLGKPLLAGRIDVRADGILGHTSNIGPLGDCVTFRFLNDGPIDGLVE